jgi:hypothetical protein
MSFLDPLEGTATNIETLPRREKGCTGNWTALRIKSDIDCCRYQGWLSSREKDIEGNIPIGIAYLLFVSNHVPTPKMDNGLCHYPSKANRALPGQASINGNRAMSIGYIIRDPSSTAVCWYCGNWRQLFLKLLVNRECLLRFNLINSGATGRKPAESREQQNK